MENDTYDDRLSQPFEQGAGQLNTGGRRRGWGEREGGELADDVLRKEGRKECEEGGGESGGWLVRKKEEEGRELDWIMDCGQRADGQSISRFSLLCIRILCPIV